MSVTSNADTMVGQGLLHLAGHALELLFRAAHLLGSGQQFQGWQLPA